MYCNIVCVRILSSNISRTAKHLTSLTRSSQSRCANTSSRNHFQFLITRIPFWVAELCSCTVCVICHGSIDLFFINAERTIIFVHMIYYYCNRVTIRNCNLCDTDNAQQAHKPDSTSENTFNACTYIYERVFHIIMYITYIMPNMPAHIRWSIEYNFGQQ